MQGFSCKSAVGGVGGLAIQNVVVVLLLRVEVNALDIRVWVRGTSLAGCLAVSRETTSMSILTRETTLVLSILGIVVIGSILIVALREVAFAFFLGVQPTRQHYVTVRNTDAAVGCVG